MKSKKVSYIELLKEAIHEYDTSKSVDVKGPMLDSILQYNGGGELQTHKDAASILERYYFDKDSDRKVSVIEHEDNEIDEVPPKEDSGVAGEKKDIEKEITEQDEEAAEEAKDEEKEEVEEIENAVIENMIKEMEEEGDEGAGTQAAGTGDAEKQIPPRNDETNEADCFECGLMEEDDEAADENKEDKEEDLDVDKELEEADMGPLKTPSEGEDEELEEAFRFFKEQIEEEPEKEEGEKEEEAEETNEADEIESEEEEEEEESEEEEEE